MNEKENASDGGGEKSRSLVELVEELDISFIVPMILNESPRMAYYKFPLDAMIRALIWAEARGIRDYSHLAYLLERNRKDAKTLGFKTHLRYPSLNLVHITPIWESFDSFKRCLEGEPYRVITKLASDIKRELNEGDAVE